MFDVITYALLKKQIAQAEAGIEKIEFIDGNLIITVPGGAQLTTPIDIAGFGAENVSFNEETNTITFSFSDGTTLNFSAPSRKEFEEQETKLESLVLENTKIQEKVSSLSEEQEKLVQQINSFGFSVVDGQLNVTYKEEETTL